MFGVEGLSHEARYVTDAFAADETETLFVNGAQFRAFVRENPGSALDVMSQRDVRDPWWVPAPLEGSNLQTPIKVALARIPDDMDTDTDVVGLLRIAADHLATVREKIAKLKKLEHELERIVSHCDGHSIEDCYVIRALSDHGLCDHDH